MDDPLKGQEEPVRVIQEKLWEGEALLRLKFLLGLVWGMAADG